MGGCFAAFMPTDFAHAQPKKPTAPEDTLASKIKLPRLSEKVRSKMDEQSEFEVWENGL